MMQRPFPALALLPLALLTVLLTSGCSGGMTSPPPDTLVRLADAEPRGLDPQIYGDLVSLRIAADQFEGLTRMNADGKAEPGLASGWTVSADGLDWRFPLRVKLRFSDGTPITARLFPALFDRLNAPATGSPHKALFGVIDSVRAEGDMVGVHLRNPFPALPALLAHPAMAALPLHRGAGWTAERPMVASGAYRLTDWRLGERVAMAANPRWHEGAPPVAGVEWRPADDPLSALRQFRGGAVDTTSDFPPSRLPWLRTNMPAATHVAPYDGVYYLVFNTRRPPFNDVRVRRALSMAIDREWIAGPMLGAGNPPAWGIVPPGISPAPYRPGWSYMPKSNRLLEASKLLAESGYRRDRPLRFTIRFNSGAEHRRVAVALAAMWRPLGVEAQMLNSEAALHFAALRSGDFDLARAGWIADLPAPENLLAIHRSDAGAANYSGLRDPLFDRMLDHAEQIAEPEKRAQAMRAAEARLMDDAAVLPLYYYVSRALVSPRIGGWRDNAGNVHPSRTLRIESRR